MNQYRLFAAFVATIALLICIMAPILVLIGDSANYEQNFRQYKTWFNWATLAWFLSAPFWLVPEIFQKNIEEE